MALQIFLLLGFQAVYGYVYTELAILIGLFMAGIALGSWLGMRRERANRSWTLAAAQLLLTLAAPALLLAVARNRGLFVAAPQPGLRRRSSFPRSRRSPALLGGFQFVTAAGIFLRGRGQGAGFGLLYAIDLLGGCVGALALSTFLIPVFGFWRTAWLARRDQRSGHAAGGARLSISAHFVVYLIPNP